MLRPRLLVPLAMLLLGTMLLATACGDDDDDDDDDTTPTATATEAPGGGTMISATLSEWAVAPETSSVDAGEVTFVVSNEGSIDHEFLIIRSDEAPDALPVDSGQVPEDDIDVVDEIEPFSAGATEEITVDLPAGNYLLICNIAGHYEAGMRTAFTVN
jgi:uncharacterized cupredoxin-like copper-binding protein